MDTLPEARIHPSAEISPHATIGRASAVWHLVHVREGATIGSESTLGRGVYVDRNVSIGSRVKIQNYVSVYEGVTIEDGVFVGPHVCFTNDRRPRAVTSEFEPMSDSDWEIVETRVERGASIGANSTIVAGVTIGVFAMIGAGSVVTKDVPAYGLAVGTPARLVGMVDEKGEVVERL